MVAKVYLASWSNGSMLKLRNAQLRRRSGPRAPGKSCHGYLCPWRDFCGRGARGRRGETVRAFLIVIGTISACRRRSRSQSVGEWSRDRGAPKGVSAIWPQTTVLTRLLGEILVEELLRRAGFPGLNSRTLVSNAVDFLVSEAQRKKKKRLMQRYNNENDGETTSNGDG